MENENKESELTSSLEDMRKKIYFKDASKKKRLFNSILDSIFYAFLTVPLLFVLETLSENNEELTNVITTIFPIFYYIIMEAILGQTLGKMITNTVVVTEDGEKPTLGTILLRTIVRFIPFDAFSYLGQRDTGWHDRWSKTRVVSKDYTEIDMVE